MKTINAANAETSVMGRLDEINLREWNKKGYNKTKE